MVGQTTFVVVFPLITNIGYWGTVYLTHRVLMSYLTFKGILQTNPAFFIVTICLQSGNITQLLFMMD